MKDLLEFVLLTAIVIIGGLKLTSWLENENYKKVAEYCDKENIVMVYDNNGDAYYTCNK